MCGIAQNVNLQCEVLVLFFATDVTYFISLLLTFSESTEIKLKTHTCLCVGVFLWAVCHYFAVSFT